MRVMFKTAQQPWTRVVSSRLVGTNHETPKAGLSFKQSQKTALPLKMGPIGCPETSVTNYQSTPLTSQKSEDVTHTAAEPEITPCICQMHYIK
jgi:hypothetical protein